MMSSFFVRGAGTRDTLVAYYYYSSTCNTGTSSYYFCNPIHLILLNFVLLLLICIIRQTKIEAELGRVETQSSPPS